MKPQLAEDAILDKVIFPCIVQPKIDGVRALNMSGTLTGRSLDPFAGYGITERFSLPEFVGFDGEMILGSNPRCSNRLCSMTTGAMGRFKDVTEMADLHWFLFDFITGATAAMSYVQRYEALKNRVVKLGHPRLHLVPIASVANAEELTRVIAENAEAGYEGTIIRNPLAPFKEGRATQKGQQLWRVKPWSDFEIMVTGITEGQRNDNEAKTNTLGRTERSSAKAGMVPNNQVGSLQGFLLADFKDPLTGKVLFERGLEITAGSGEMSVAEASDYFQYPTKIVGHIAKVKTMTHGVKDKPRFPTYASHRMAQDMS